MNNTQEKVSATPTPAQHPFRVVLVGRQSYNMSAEELTLLPIINRIASLSAATAIEAYELYEHVMQISGVLNDQIEEVIQEFEEAKSDQEEDEEDNNESEIVDISDNEVPSLDFSEVFHPEFNSFLAPITNGLHPFGYSSTNVYVEALDAEGKYSKTVQPESFTEFLAGIK